MHKVICISERGVDHCVRCIDTCDASHFKRAVEELKKIAEKGEDSGSREEQLDLD